MSRPLTPAAPAARSAPHVRGADASPIHDAIAPAAPWIEWFARVGYAAKALLYSVVGFLALQSALGSGGDTIGSRGALVTLVRQDYGPLILIVIAAGLFGYAAWRVAEAILDPERRGTSPKGIALRTSFAARGLIHAALGVQAVRLASGSARTRGQAVEEWTARALEAPLGAWLVIGAGAAVAGYGLYQIYRAWAAKLSRDLDLSRLSREAGSWLIKASRFGIAARGVVFAISGFYLARAGYAHNARAAADTGEALDAIGQQPFGEWMLATVAFGLIAYGAYEIVQARYRVIRPA